MHQRLLRFYSRRQGDIPTYDVKMASENSSQLLVAAIDFGTTFSSWACSFRHDYEKDPTKIRVKEWNSGVGISSKAPTSVLIRPDGETLEAFGYDAEDKYGRLAGKDEHKDWYYFIKFKMSLYNDKSLTRRTIINDEMGKKMAAIKVISLVIRYMKDDLCKQMEPKIAGKLLPEDIQWVLTVPAIWNDKARQFMREAAVQAGISDNQLLISLEPEAASLYCRRIPLELKESDGTSSIVPLSSGTRYIVVDAGGGTTDITIHEILEDGNVKEMYKATGGAWGGQEVDEAFKQFLIKIFGAPVLQKFKVEVMEDYIGLFREFELKKRKVSLNGNEGLTFSIPASLLEIFRENTGETLTEAINQTQFASNVRVIKENKLRLDPSIMRSFFDTSLRSVCEHLQTFHEDNEKYGISVALLVGGYAESPMLSGAIRENCSSWKVLVPDDASLTVLKGAVLYGYDQSTIVYRVARYTYGVSVFADFIAGVHPLEQLVVNDEGNCLCDNIFETFLTEGTLLRYGQIVYEQKGFVPPDSKTNFMNIEIYASTDEDTKFITNGCCFLLGNLIVTGLDTSIPRSQRKVDVTITHKGTDLHVYATDTQSGRKLNACIDLLD
ncbi:hypothetical protein ACJMK2_031240 [Sinanodonta woodiana]|uniref:Heat shock 70 kDa protein 12A n=1 Tax=Sinanodonta woodiana TaxID=1069815 RepID=A0ABD3WY66_SINWO